MRLGTDTINTYNASNPYQRFSFASGTTFFNPNTAINKFLVLGADSGQLAGSPDNGTFGFAMPFSVAAGALESIINDKCTQCHTPMAHTESKKDGTLATQLVFEGSILEAGHPNHNAAMDVVSCKLCHQIPDSPALGTLPAMSGNYAINDTKSIYGSFCGSGETAIFPNPIM